jgi:RNA polymerase sigma factor for flagellar operon FliA
MQIVFLKDLSGGQEEEDDFLDHFQDTQESDPHSILREKRMRMALINAIKALPEREQQIMSLYYEQDMNYKEIALTLSLTESRICQLLRQIIEILKKAMQKH